MKSLIQYFPIITPPAIDIKEFELKEDILLIRKILIIALGAITALTLTLLLPEGIIYFTCMALTGIATECLYLFEETRAIKALDKQAFTINTDELEESTKDSVKNWINKRRDPRYKISPFQRLINKESDLQKENLSEDHKSFLDKYLFFVPFISSPAADVYNYCIDDNIAKMARPIFALMALLWIAAAIINPLITIEFGPFLARQIYVIMLAVIWIFTFKATSNFEIEKATKLLNSKASKEFNEQPFVSWNLMTWICKNPALLKEMIESKCDLQKTDVFGDGLFEVIFQSDDIPGKSLELCIENNVFNGILNERRTSLLKSLLNHGDKKLDLIELCFDKKIFAASMFSIKTQVSIWQKVRSLKGIELLRTNDIHLTDLSIDLRCSIVNKLIKLFSGLNPVENYPTIIYLIQNKLVTHLNFTQNELSDILKEIASEKTANLLASFGFKFDAISNEQKFSFLYEKITSCHHINYEKNTLPLIDHFLKNKFISLDDFNQEQKTNLWRSVRDKKTAELLSKYGFDFRGLEQKMKYFIFEKNCAGNSEESLQLLTYFLEKTLFQASDISEENLIYLFKAQKKTIELLERYSIPLTIIDEHN